MTEPTFNPYDLPEKAENTAFGKADPSDLAAPAENQWDSAAHNPWNQIDLDAVNETARAELQTLEAENADAVQEVQATTPVTKTTVVHDSSRPGKYTGQRKTTFKAFMVLFVAFVLGAIFASESNVTTALGFLWLFAGALWVLLVILSAFNWLATAGEPEAK